MREGVNPIKADIVLDGIAFKRKFLLRPVVLAAASEQSRSCENFVPLLKAMEEKLMVIAACFLLLFYFSNKSAEFR